MHQLTRQNGFPQPQSSRFVWVYQDGNECDGSARYSADIYDLNVKDEFGSPLCIAAGVYPESVDKCWNQYLASRGYTVETDDSPALNGPDRGLEL